MIINNFRDDYLNMKIATKTLKVRSYTLTYDILTVVPVDYLIDILYGRVLKILSVNAMFKDGKFLTATAISHDLGIDVINRYFYTLYKQESKLEMSFSD